MPTSKRLLRPFHDPHRVRSILLPKHGQLVVLESLQRLLFEALAFSDSKNVAQAPWRWTNDGRFNLKSGPRPVGRRAPGFGGVSVKWHRATRTETYGAAETSRKSSRRVRHGWQGSSEDHKPLAKGVSKKEAVGALKSTAGTTSFVRRKSSRHHSSIRIILTSCSQRRAFGTPRWLGWWCTASSG